MHTGLQFWATLRDGRWIDQNVPDANHPLTNGNFRQRFYRHGFDWLPLEDDGVHIDQFVDEPSIDIGLSGDQPEHCTLLRQYVAVEGGFLYKLIGRPRRRAFPQASALPGTSPGKPEPWPRLGFRRSAGCKTNLGICGDSQRGWIRAHSGINRPSGHVRPAGHITLRSVTMDREQ